MIGHIPLLQCNTTNRTQLFLFINGFDMTVVVLDSRKSFQAQPTFYFFSWLMAARRYRVTAGHVGQQVFFGVEQVNTHTTGPFEDFVQIRVMKVFIFGILAVTFHQRFNDHFIVFAF
jgi:hypothetical protein